MELSPQARILLEAHLEWRRRAEQAWRRGIDPKIIAKNADIDVGHLYRVARDLGWSDQPKKIKKIIVPQVKLPKSARLSRFITARPKPKNIKGLHSALESIKDMPYWQNERAGGRSSKFGHEDAVGEKFIEAGFNEIKEFPKISKNTLKRWADTGDDTEIRKILKDMPPGTFIRQPGGTQDFPDFLIHDHNKGFIPLECKSTQGEGAMWNDNVPHLYALYVLSSAKANETTLFIGRDVITQEGINLLQEQIDAQRKAGLIYDSRIKSSDKFHRGWQMHFRKQFQQKAGEKEERDGGAAYSNFFRHPDRARCEKNAINLFGIKT